jgi:ABC-type nitrate/sulfonate/bicarbonate transport system permease component
MTISTPKDSVGAAVARSVGRALLTMLASLAVLVFAWWALLKIIGLNPLVAKGPADVWHYFFTARPPRGVRPAGLDGTAVTAAAARSGAWHAALTTLGHAGLGFGVGMAVALLIASLFVLVAPFEFAFMPIAMLLRSVPLVAMAPLILLIFGQGTLAITLIGTVVVLFPAMINIILGLRSATPLALDLIQVYGGRRLATLLRVQLPSSLPNLFAAVRISVPGAMVGAMLGEYIVGFEGIGGEINTAHGIGHSTQVWALAVISVVMSFVIYSITIVIETAVLAAWGPDAGRR